LGSSLWMSRGGLTWLGGSLWVWRGGLAWLGSSLWMSRGGLTWLGGSLWVWSGGLARFRGCFSAWANEATLDRNMRNLVDAFTALGGVISIQHQHISRFAAVYVADLAHFSSSGFAYALQAFRWHPGLSVLLGEWFSAHDTSADWVNVLDTLTTTAVSWGDQFVALSTCLGADFGALLDAVLSEDARLCACLLIINSVGGEQWFFSSVGVGTSAG